MYIYVYQFELNMRLIYEYDYNIFRFSIFVQISRTKYHHRTNRSDGILL